MRKIGVWLVALILAPAALAQTAGTDGAVRIYTNVDLALLEPHPAESDAEAALVGSSASDASRANDEENWKFVSDFIAREHAKVHADRDYELERQRVDNEAEEERGYGVPYLGYYGYYGYPGYYRGPDDHRPGHGRHHVRRDDGSRSRTHVPHPMFRENPPVREHVPGLGNSYRRGRAAHRPGGRR